MMDPLQTRPTAVIEDLRAFVAVVTPSPHSTLKHERVKWPEVEFSRLLNDRDMERSLFRGQGGADWTLVPKIDRIPFAHYRTMHNIGRRQHEEEILAEFSRAGRPHLGLTPANRWEWLSIAQHHGLATRLLDWTTNPLVALYFAVEEQDVAQDAAVWFLAHAGAFADSTVDPFESDTILVAFPAHLTPRISTQSACFSVHPEAHAGWSGSLRKFLIPATARRRILQQLAGIGITRASLFPDLDGIALEINRGRSLRQNASEATGHE